MMKDAPEGKQSQLWVAHIGLYGEGGGLVLPINHYYLAIRQHLFENWKQK
jgi:hypothetical protein